MGLREYSATSRGIQLSLLILYLSSLYSYVRTCTLYSCVFIPQECVGRELRAKTNDSINGCTRIIIFLQIYIYKIKLIQGLSTTCISNLYWMKQDSNIGPEVIGKRHSHV